MSRRGKYTINLSVDEVIHCTIFDCKHGVYPKTICCRACPVYDECEDHCQNHPDRCNVWESPKKRHDRESIIRQISHGIVEEENV